MSELPPSTRKSATALRARRANSAANWPQPTQQDNAEAPLKSAQKMFSSIPRMPTILSSEEAATSQKPSRKPRAPQQASQDALSDSGKRRTLMDGATGRQRAVRNERAAAMPKKSTAAPRKRPDRDAEEEYTVPTRTREQNAARPLSSIPGTLKLPSIPQKSAAPERYTLPAEDEEWDEWNEDEWAEDEWEQETQEADAFDAASGRELIPVAEQLLPIGYATMPSDSIPDLAAFRPAVQVRPRPRLNTQRLIEQARSPWSVSRTILAVIVMLVTLFTAVGVMGEPSQGLMQTAFASSAGGVGIDAPSIASKVRPETQMTQASQYDNNGQFQAWGNADCSAATASEVLTAWGVHGATIGKMIDVMQPDISLNGGLLHISGFQRGVSVVGYHADVRNNLSYKQLIYLTHTLGLPVIVNVRISYGYFHFFDGGHFLVMTDGDNQGLRIVDSSEYYITYLPRDVFYSMFTGITVVIVPNGYDYSIP